MLFILAFLDIQSYVQTSQDLSSLKILINNDFFVPCIAIRMSPKRQKKQLLLIYCDIRANFFPKTTAWFPFTVSVDIFGSTECSLRIFRSIFYLASNFQGAECPKKTNQQWFFAIFNFYSWLFPKRRISNDFLQYSIFIPGYSFWKSPIKIFRAVSSIRS